MNDESAPLLYPPAMEALDRIWQQHGLPDRWVFTTKGLKNGDLYMALTSFPAFKARHAPDTSIDLLCITKPHLKIAELFAEVFDNIYFVPDLEWIRPIEIQYWCMTKKHDRFAPGNLIYLHPAHMAHGQFAVTDLIAQYLLSFTDCCRLMLKVPLQTAPAVPRITETQRERAALLAKESGVELWNTIILFPYAESLMQDAVGHFASFAKRAGENGIRVLTSVAGKEEAIEGSSPVFIPFDLLLPFTELAGNALIVRSGIADILASADCRKLILYPYDHAIQTSSIVDMGLGTSAVEVVFPMDRRSVEEFVDLAASVFFPVSSPTRPSEIPSFVAAYFAQQGANYEESVSAVSADITSSLPSLGLRRFRAQRGIVLADGWSGIEEQGVWSDGFRAVIYLRNPFVRWSSQADKRDRINVVLDVVGSISLPFPTLGIGVTVYGSKHDFVLGWPLPQANLTVPIPDVAVGDPVWRIAFDFDSPKSPHEQSGGKSSDLRLLGIRLRSVQVSRRLR